MKGKLFLTAALLAVLLATCGAAEVFDSRDAQKTAAQELGIDTAEAVELEGMESHGGFHGDGTTFLKLQFSQPPQFGDGWRELPMSETVTALVYGTRTEASSIGPYIPEGLIPEVERGWYFFCDRHSQREDPWDESLVLERGSQNFTLAVYDEAANILYYVEHDT